jgi:hypothetical protein
LGVLERLLNRSLRFDVRLRQQIGRKRMGVTKTKRIAPPQPLKKLLGAPPALVARLGNELREQRGKCIVTLLIAQADDP